jgi:glucokinase
LFFEVMEKTASTIPVAACVDIGGTKALLGLVTQAGVILAREKIFVSREYDPHILAAEMALRLRGLAERNNVAWKQVCGVGYSTTGMLDVDSGMIFSSPNQGGWRNVPFAHLLQDSVGLPARIEMDANAAALGEAWLGVGKEADPFTFVIVGTGIGMGIITNGSVFRGWRGTAGEIGHMVIDLDGPLCNCGQHGCLESLASGPAIARRARLALDKGAVSRMVEFAAQGDITAITVFQAARLGDEVAIEIVNQTVEYLAVGLTNLIHLLNPRVIAIGGGVGLGGADLLVEPLRQSVSQQVGPWVDMNVTTIAPASLGSEAGLLGAAWLVWNQLNKD